MLFVQFSGVAFIFSLLTLILTQSYHIISKNRGFDYERVAYADGAYFKKDSEAAHAIIKSFPYVEDLTSIFTSSDAELKEMKERIEKFKTNTIKEG